MEGRNNGGTVSSQGETPRKGKKHPPLPKPRPPSSAEPVESKTPVKSDNFECSTSEDEDGPARRAPPRQSKKQKRVQKNLEVKEDKAVLKEMRNPYASTSGPLMREQEKIRKMYPKKFLSLDSNSPNADNMNLNTTNGQDENSNDTSKVDEEVGTETAGATRKRAKVIRNGGFAVPSRPTRSSIRMKRNVDDDSDSNHLQGGENNETKTAKNLKRLEQSDEIKTLSDSTGSRSVQTSPQSSQGSKTDAKLSESPQSTHVAKPMPVPAGKRGRRLPKRLMSPDMADLPPVLFRVSSRGSLTNLMDEDEGPPILKPVHISPQTPKLSKHFGKENKLFKEKNLKGPRRRSTPVPQDCDPVKEKTSEPARKRVARSRNSSATSTPVVTVNRNSPPKDDDSNEQPKPRTRTSNLRSKSNLRSTPSRT